MKYKPLGLLWIAALFLIGIPAANALTLELNNVLNSGLIRFDGDASTFEFVPAASGSPSFNIVTSGGNLTGIISGTFGVGSVDTSLGPYQTATVTGTRELTIFDTDGTTAILTAQVSFTSIYTINDGGGINKVTTNANVDTIAYSSSGNSDLQALVDAAAARISFTFDLPDGQDLASAMDGTDGTPIVETVSYSGKLTPVPVPAAVWLFGSALMGATVIARRKKSSLPKEMVA